MDANQTRFHLLLGKDDWGDCLLEGTPLRLLWDVQSPPASPSPAAYDVKHNELTLRSRLYRFPVTKSQIVVPIEARRGAARDQYGNWYWIDADSRTILIVSSGTGDQSIFWPPAPEAGTSPEQSTFHPIATTPAVVPYVMRGLTVTEDHYLVVGVLRTSDQRAGLLIFDLHAGGPPTVVEWPDTVAFEPFDMAAAPCGGVWILDRANHRYWKLDRHFNVIRHPRQDESEDAAMFSDFSADGQPEPPAPGRRFPRGVSLDDASPLTSLDPVAIEALPDDTVLILDRVGDGEFSDVYRYRFGEPHPQRVSTRVLQQALETSAAQSLKGHDMAFVPDYESFEDRAEDRLFIVSEDGNQAFAFMLTERSGMLELSVEPEYLPMRLFTERSIVAAGKQAYYDSSDNWIPLIAQRRARYETNAILETPLAISDPAHSTVRSVFDGREPNCIWHRLMLDACIPSDATLKVWSRAANDPDDLPNRPWLPEPIPHMRSDGSELPYQPDTAYSTFELLFQHAVGRYLQLRLEMSGSGRTAPRIRALRAAYPRFSYLNNYMPALYRNDQRSASFLDRFLANIEGFFTSIEDEIAAVQILADVRSAPSDALEWFASWIGLALNPMWDETRRRLMLAHAMQFYQMRGTRRGLQTALHLALDSCVDDTLFESASDTLAANRIRILERFLTRTANQDARETAHQFTVSLPVPLGDARFAGGGAALDNFKARAEQVVDAEKPAHTVFDVSFHWALFRLGEVRLGEDSIVDLGGRSPELMRAMTLGRGYLSEAYLAPGHPQNVTTRTVLGRDRIQSGPNLTRMRGE